MMIILMIEIMQGWGVSRRRRGDGGKGKKHQKKARRRQRARSAVGSKKGGPGGGGGGWGHTRGRTRAHQKERASYTILREGGEGEQEKGGRGGEPTLCARLFARAEK